MGAGAADPDDAAGMMRQKRARGLYSPCRHREAGIRAGIARHSDDRRGHLSRKRPLAGLTMTAMGQNGWSWHIVSQKVTVSLGGYPRGYITEPQQSSFPPSARPRIYPRTYPWAYSWTYPRFYPWTPGPSAIPTASAVAPARPHACMRGTCDPKSHNPYTHPAASDTAGSDSSGIDSAGGTRLRDCGGTRLRGE